MSTEQAIMPGGRLIDRFRLSAPSWLVRSLPDGRRRTYFRAAIDARRFDRLTEIVGRRDPFANTALFAAVDRLLTDGDDALLPRLAPLAEGLNAYQRGIFKALTKHAEGQTDAARAHLDRYGAGDRFDPFSRMCARAWSLFLRLPRLPHVDVRSDGAPAIMQFWDSDDVPADVMAAISTWRDGAGSGHLLFHAQAARDFLLAAYGREAARVFDLCPHPAVQSDYFRLGWLLRHGGMYVDADDRMMPGYPSASPLFGGRLVVRFCSSRPTAHFMNGLIAAPSGSRTVAALFEEAGRRIAEEPDDHVMALAGPGMLTDVLVREAAAGRLEDLAVLTTGFAHSHVLGLVDAAYKRDVRSWHLWQAERGQ